MKPTEKLLHGLVEAVNEFCFKSQLSFIDTHDKFTDKCIESPTHWIITIINNLTTPHWHPVNWSHVLS